MDPKKPGFICSSKGGASCAILDEVAEDYEGRHRSSVDVCVAVDTADRESTLRATLANKLLDRKKYHFIASGYFRERISFSCIQRGQEREYDG